MKVAKDVDACLFGSLRMENDNNESESGKVFLKIGLYVLHQSVCLLQALIT